MIDWRSFIFYGLYVFLCKIGKSLPKKICGKFLSRFPKQLSNNRARHTYTPSQNINQASSSRSAQIENYYIFYLVDYCAIMLLCCFPVFCWRISKSFFQHFARIFLHLFCTKKLLLYSYCASKTIKKQLEHRLL